jgi:hypothetical protein
VALLNCCRSTVASHNFAAGCAGFDEEHLVSCAELVPVMPSTLANAGE